MRAFLWHRRWWVLAITVLLAALGAALFVARDADDGSERAWKMVQPGMTRGQVDEILARTPPYMTQQGSALDKSYWYRDHVLRIDFDKDMGTVIAKFRGRRASWWEKLLIDLRRVRAALGVLGLRRVPRYSIAKMKEPIINTVPMEASLYWSSAMPKTASDVPTRAMVARSAYVLLAMGSSIQNRLPSVGCAIGGKIPRNLCAGLRAGMRTTHSMQPKAADG